jgi:UDP-2,3-diacylglucosamine pyrophosphatase LpxH
VDTIICGHCHEARRETFDLAGGGKGTLWTLGAWEDEASYLEYSGGEFRRMTFR